MLGGAGVGVWLTIAGDFLAGADVEKSVAIVGDDYPVRSWPGINPCPGRELRAHKIKPYVLGYMLTCADLSSKIGQGDGTAMPTHEWTMTNDGHGSRPRSRRKTYLIIALGVPGLLGLFGVLYLIGAPGSTPSLGPKSYRTNVHCQVNTVGSQGTVTISGTIRGDSTSYSVTVEVVDAASRQRIGLQTFEVRGTTTFGGTTPAQAPIGPAGIDCKITKVA